MMIIGGEGELFFEWVFALIAPVCIHIIIEADFAQDFFVERVSEITTEN